MQIMELASPLSFAIENVEDKDWMKTVQVHEQFDHDPIGNVCNICLRYPADFRMLNFFCFLIVHVAVKSRYVVASRRTTTYAFFMYYPRNARLQRGSVGN